jgi:predicted nucleic acid-binding protein
LAHLRTLVDTSVLVSTSVDTSVLVAAAGADDVGPWCVSAVSVGELEAGVLLASDGPTTASRLRRLAAVVAEAPLLAIDLAVAARYGELRAASGRAPSNDLWIAATALAHDLTLLTADRRQSALPLVRARLL